MSGRAGSRTSARGSWQRLGVHVTGEVVEGEPRPRWVNQMAGEMIDEMREQLAEARASSSRLNESAAAAAELFRYFCWNKRRIIGS